jgi:hypothetical protein
MGRGGNNQNLLYGDKPLNDSGLKTKSTLYSVTDKKAQPKMIAVESSNIEAIGYNEDKRELHISYKPDKKGHQSHGYYSDVPKHYFDEMLGTPSKGKYQHAVLGPELGNFKYLDLDNAIEIII